MHVRWIAAGVAAATLCLAGCSEGGGEDALVARGRSVYLNNCTACHARDPHQVGPVGPAIAGSPLELLQAKVIRGEYPPGYVPQRDSHAMVPLPHLAPDLPAVAAFLAQGG
jgi:mono/diheme cytochrome c family protein